jgi:formylglycine-generating enzyme required for sulfatase activity
MNSRCCIASVAFVVSASWTVFVAAQTEQTEVRNSLGMRLVKVPAGQFVRGEMHGDLLRKNHPFSTGPTGSHDARPAHRVKISTSFQIGVTEVTVEQFRKFVEATGYRTSAEKDGQGPLVFQREATDGIDRFRVDSQHNWRDPGFPQTDNHPVVCVSWNDAGAFCRWLTKAEDTVYRLPSEAEWEYAARGGATTSYIGGNSADTVYAHGNVADAQLEAAHPGMTLRQRIARLNPSDGDGFVYTAPVASLKPNRFGLFDTHGNVWEWCSDKYHDRYYSDLTKVTVMHRDVTTLPIVEDPQGPQTTPNHEYGDWRSVRGGAWCTGPISSRCASRSFADASDAFCYTGFRVVCKTP